MGVFQMPLMTETQLANLLNTSIRTLQSQRQRGNGIPFIKLGKSVRYDLDTVREYLNDNYYNSTTHAYKQGKSPP